MTKLFEFFVEAVFWLLTFLSPALLFGMPAGILYLMNPANKLLPGGLLFLGIALGVWLAEWARRKYGSSNFISRLNASPDMDDMDSRKEKLSKP